MGGILKTVLDMAKTVLKDRAFVVCAAVLLVAAAGLHSTVEMMGLRLRKLPVPLRRELDDFDMSKMYPYQLYGERARLQYEMEEELGTTQYLQCVFEDTTVEDGKAPGKFIRFFVTYYTGSLDQVPHVPEECYIGGGYDQITGGTVVLDVPGIGLEDDQLRVNEAIFQNPQSLMQVKMPVIYFFSVNGAFKATRTDARLSLANPTTRYSYFSKVELAFAGEVQPARPQALKLAGKFLAKALPILMNDHWPDWEAVVRKSDEPVPADKGVSK